MKAIARMRKWREDPVVMVRELFGVEPDPWQIDVLHEFGRAQRIAMKACKGPGKTCVIAWCCWNFLLTRPHPKIAATSITGDNLRDGLWTEMAKWQNKSPLLREMFVWNKERIFSKHHPETWWMSARSWSKSADADQQANTLAGLHADYMLFVIDEAGGVPNGVMAAAEAALASGIETKLLIAGNPTHLSGPLYDACTRERGLWYVIEVTGDPDDPKRTPRVSAQWAREQIEKYGRDNPWVLVNVFGKFPPSSLNALIGPDEVLAAMERLYKPEVYMDEGRALGVDVAREGDDSSVVFPRQGLVAFMPEQYRIRNSLDVAAQVMRFEDEWEADAVYVDETGGYGAAVIDAGQKHGRGWIGVQFAGSPIRDSYANKRAEMWWEMAQWIKRGGALPRVMDLVDELSKCTYTYRGDKILMMPKEQLKEIIGRSPDHADALGLTFAYPTQKTYRSLPKTAGRLLSSQQKATADYDPFACM